MCLSWITWKKAISPKKGAKSVNTHLSIFSLEDSAQESDLAPFFGDLSQREKFSEIKPHIGLKKSIHIQTFRCPCSTNAS